MPRAQTQTDASVETRTQTRTERTAGRQTARLTANATVWMAIFTLFLALTSIGTLFILWNQLGEMHSGGGDTHTLAEATHDMALQGEQNFIDEQRPYMFIDPYLTDKAGKAILKGRPVFYVGQKSSFEGRLFDHTGRHRRSAFSTMER